MRSRWGWARRADQAVVVRLEGDRYLMSGLTPKRAERRTSVDVSKVPVGGHQPRDSPNGRLWNVGRGRPYCALMLAARTTLPHFSVSSAMNFPKSVGEPANTAHPRSVRRLFMLGSARAALISLLSFSTICVGVALGTTIPYQPLASKPGRNSPTVGTSGRASWRVALVTASARSLPALMYPSDAGMTPK